jgi:HSP20 family protein
MEEFIMTTLTRFNPYFGNGARSTLSGLDRLLEDVLGDVNWHTPSGTSKKNPMTNVNETETEYNISVVAPGLKKSDFAITLENTLLSISYENQSETVDTLSQDPFKYNWKTPQGVSGEDIKAKYDDGILKVAVKKAAAQQVVATTIKVK